jgi:hypothetical protein
MRLLALNGLLGYGYPAESLINEFARKIPDYVGVDAGSTDPGPYYLGSGKSFTNRQAVKRDVEIALPLTLANKVPFIIGTAGGAGGDVHIAWLKDIIDEIARERHLNFRMAIIHTEVKKDYLKTKLRAGKIRPLGQQLKITEQVIDDSARIVSQIGVDPFIKALDKGVDVILAGRACDTAIYAAPAIRAGFDPGLAYHMGKIMECGCMCAFPQSASDVITAAMEDNSFVLEPANSARKCTVERVAAHTMYEQSSPFHIYEPDGMVDVEHSKYEQISDRAVRVSKSRFIPADVKTIKIEGARLAGYRTITIGSIKEQLTIKKIDEIFEEIKQYVDENIKASIGSDQYQIILRKFGLSPAGREDCPAHAHDLVVILDVVGRTQEIANTICALARARMLHYDYPGRKTTAGNLALIYSPSDMQAGPVYNFSIYHLVEVNDLSETASIEYVKAGV